MSQTIISGIVNSDGTTSEGSGNFKVIHDQAGIYTVFFDFEFNDLPAVTATQIYPNDVDDNGGDTYDNAVLVGIATDRFRVKTGNSSNPGHATDRDFSFIAVGTADDS